MAVWYPGALIVTGKNAGSFVSGYAKKGLLHTTEGSTAAGAIGAYRATGSWPHFTVNRSNQNEVYQHISIDLAARALENPPGGVETNRGGAIQIEVVGFASEAGRWPPGQVAALKKLMRWIEQNADVKTFGPKFGGSDQYGLHNSLQFSGSYWKTFNGWCGHQHVPENRHWDPGAINLALLLPSVIPGPVIPTPSPITVVKTIEVDMQVSLVNVQIATDNAGNGWARVPYQIDTILSYLPGGVRPGADGFYETAEVGIAQQDPDTIISVYGWAPNNTFLVRLRVAV